MSVNTVEYANQLLAENERLKRQVQQLAAENAGLKTAAEFATAPDMWVEQADGMLDYRYHEWYVDVLKTAMETPATDAWLNEVRAQGLISFAQKCRETARDPLVHWNNQACFRMVADQAEEFATKLRAGEVSNG